MVGSWDGFWGVIFQMEKNIDLNEVKPHEELFDALCICQISPVIRSILKDVMFFVHLDISGYQWIVFSRHG